MPTRWRPRSALPLLPKAAAEVSCARGYEGAAAATCRQTTDIDLVECLAENPDTGELMRGICGEPTLDPFQDAALHCPPAGGGMEIVECILMRTQCDPNALPALGGAAEGARLYAAAVLAPSGVIFAIPSSHSAVLTIDLRPGGAPEPLAYGEVTDSGEDKWSDGVLCVHLHCARARASVWFISGFLTYRAHTQGA